MEAEFVEWLRSRVAARSELPLALGDDASLFIDPANERLVTTVDLLCEGVHFRLDETSWELIGRKSLAVNLSDMAAMAARPRLALVSIAWPRHRDPMDARRLYEGLFQLADEHRVVLAGGDTNSWDGGLVVSVTVIGQATERGVLRRGGAQVGDRILVSGSLGGSLLGHHLRFEPRIALALDLNQRYTLHAGMDLSDGLSLDLARLVKESGVAAELDLRAIPISDAAHQMSQASGRSPLQHALSDGEDFELLITAPPESADAILRDATLPIPITPIGTIVEGMGVWTCDSSGARQRLPAEGYLH